MSVFSKPPNDGRGGDGPTKPDPQATKLPASTTTYKQVAPRPQGPAAPAKPAAPAPIPAAASPAAPSVVVTRSIDVAGPARTQARPAMPNIHIGPPPAAPAASPAPSPAAAPGAPSAATELAQPRTNTLPMAEPASPPSTRPHAPDLGTGEQTVSIADTFERLLSSEDLDDGFAFIVRQPSVPGVPEALPTDLAEVRGLFAQLAANHVRQVRDFLIDLRWGEATLDWIAICQPALRSLRRAAEKLELAELCTALDAFTQSLLAARTTGSRTIEGDARAAVLARHDELVQLMPQAFALDLDRTQREAVILQSLLLQVPDVKKVTIDKLYAAGLTTLEAMLLANPDDIVATTGLTRGVAVHIVERFRAYHEHAKSTTPDATRARERDTIAELTARLRREHFEYELASQSWTREAGEKKKELRRARGKTLLDIQVVLARLGEVRRLEEIERLPFERKVSYLESFLEEARDKYTAQS